WGHTFGRMEPNVYASVFCNGSSVARGAMAGKLLADYATGGDSALLRDQMALPKPSWLPPDPLVSLVAWWRMRGMRRRGRHES
ncbi:MAG: hypothetical protein ACREVW_18820, partial [Burkholderiales bacterium]